MKKSIAIVFVIVFCALGFSNAAVLETAQAPLKVVATSFPSYDFVRAIAGDLLADGLMELRMLLPPGSESHSFEPTPQDIIRIQSCDLFVYIGGESEKWIDKILSSMDTDSFQILSLLDMVDVVEEEIIEGMQFDEHEREEDEEHEEDERETEYDEHVWTSPQNSILIVEALADSLCQLDRANMETYQQNAQAFIKELEALDAAFREVADAAVRKTIVVGDRFPFRYFADAYGLSYYAAFPGCATETEASASTVAFIIDRVRENNIPVIFHAELSNEKMADVIAESTNAKKLQLNACHNVTKKDFEEGITYLELMWQNVGHLKEALHE